MQQMQNRVTGFSRNSQRSLRTVGQSFGTMTRAVRIAGAAIATGLVARGIGRLVSAAASVETVTTQFETLTGSIENARDLVGDLQDFAASTPLQFDTLAQGTQRLLAFGIAQEDVIGTLNMLGDAATGDANKLDSLTRAFGKVNARGRASMEEINMVIDAGVPIMDALNQEFGTTTEELSEMIRAGQVTSDVFTNAFRRMTRDGGMFHNGMQRQSQTTAGRISTLKDNIQLTAASIGSALLPTANTLITRLTEISGKARDWINANQDLINQRVEEVIEGIGDAVRLVTRLWDSGLIPAVLAGVAAYKALATAQIVLATITTLTKGATVATMAMNAVMAINPLVWIAAAIAGVIILIKNIDKVAEFSQRSGEAVRAAFASVGEWLTNLFEPVREMLERFGGWLDRIFDRVNRVRDRIAGEDVRTADEGRERNASVYGLTTSNMGAAAMSRSESVSRSEVDIRLGNLPRGSSVTQRGRAPGVSLEYGAAGGQL
jgi:tape measure domain-containing protein